MTRTTTIRVMIVDDHDMLRTGLAVFIRSRPELRLVGEAASGAQAVALCAKVKPHVIVMDLIMPDMDGVTAITEIRKKYPHIQIIALSSFVDEALVEAALNAGAIGYLLKSVSADDLAAAIRDAHRGKSTLAPEAAQVLVTATQRPRTT